ncbi:MAG: helix-turn-helix domain-containing protein [Candidatus Omnitrophica bacterium]|nr:helix-turn-helix domain-containing protein [Candidatus Omnitrophota bacterium]
MESVGARLKKIRIEKGLSLDDVHKSTKINLSIIRALEEDNVTGFSPIYIRGFLKIYCKCLGVDPKDFVLNYKEPEKPIVKEPAVRKKSREVASTKKGSFGQVAGMILKKLRLSRELKRRLLVILVAAGVLFVVFSIGKAIVVKVRQISKRSQAKVEAQPKQETKKSAAAVAQPARSVKSTSKSSSSAPPVEKKETPAFNVRVTVMAKSNSWLTVKVDGKTVFQRMLEKGRSESWQAKDKVELSAGNAQAIELQVNGQLFSNLGRKGQALKNVVITKDGLSVPR